MVKPANPCGQYGIATPNVKPPPTDPCEGVVCPPGKICVDGYCVPDPTDPCEGVVCPPGQTCENGVCVPIPDPCEGVTCPTGQKCENGICVPDPTYDPCAGISCPDGQRCENGVCVPIDLCAGVTCPDGKICVDGICVPDPNDPCAGVVCDPGYQCVNGTCVPIPRAALFNRSQLNTMPSDLRSLVVECMDKWETFIKPNAKYTTATHPNGVLEIYFDANYILPNAYAGMAFSSSWMEQTYPYQIESGVLVLGSAWGELTTRADQLETILHELGHALGFACVHSNNVPEAASIPQIDRNTGLISPGSHYANLMSLWNQKSNSSNTSLPINGGWTGSPSVPSNNWDAHWFAYFNKTVNGELYKGVKNDIMCPGTKVTSEINIITDLTLEHARALGYEVIGTAEGEPDFSPIRSVDEYRSFGNCVFYEEESN